MRNEEVGRPKRQVFSLVFMGVCFFFTFFAVLFLFLREGDYALSRMGEGESLADLVSRIGREKKRKRKRKGEDLG